ncbi:unnamed protein product [Calypogeia fissa]
MGGRFLPDESFKSFGNYWRALKMTPARFKQRIFARSSRSEEMALVKRSGEEMKRTLGLWNLFWLTIGSIVGAGVFVHSGEVAHTQAGPSIILSYLAAGFAAILAALNFVEFAVEIPVAGGTFAYLRVELGDFVAYIAAGNIILDHIVGGAAVARTWTGYFASLINSEPNAIRIHVASLPTDFCYLDPIAVVIILILMVVAIWGTDKMALLNWISSVVSMVIIIFVITVGLFASRKENFTHSGDDNLKDGFAPFGAHGVCEAASVLFFAYLGFDEVCTLAEETKNPGRDIPLGIVSAMVVVTVIYTLLALTLSLMVPYGQIQDEAPFSYAFDYVGWKWAKYLVAVGALKGIMSVILIGSVSQGRYLTHIARTHMVSPWFAKVNRHTQTPINATVCMVIPTCVVAFFSDLFVLGDLLSISTLFIFSLVALALLVRRYIDPEKTTTKEFAIFVSATVTIFASSLAITIYWAATNEERQWVGYLNILPFWIFGTLAIQVFCPQRRNPRVWGVPFMPWIPSLTIVVTIFLLGSMDAPSYKRFGMWLMAMLVYYFLVGLHSSYDAAKVHELEMAKEKAMASSGPTDDVRMHAVATESSPDQSDLAKS